MNHNNSLKSETQVGSALGLRYRVNSCKIMTVGRAYSRLAHTYNLPIASGNQDLIRVKRRTLECWSTADVNLEKYILSKVKTCNRIIGLVRRNFKNMDF